MVKVRYGISHKRNYERWVTIYFEDNQQHASRQQIKAWHFNELPRIVKKVSFLYTDLWFCRVFLDVCKMDVLNNNSSAKSIIRFRSIKYHSFIIGKTRDIDYSLLYLDISRTFYSIWKQRITLSSTSVEHKARLKHETLEKRV